jgi:hypothetical protein
MRHHIAGGGVAHDLGTYLVDQALSVTRRTQVLGAPEPLIGRGCRPQAPAFGVPVRRARTGHVRRQLTGGWRDDRAGPA